MLRGAPSAAREAILKEPEGGMIVEDDTDELAILAGRYAASRCTPAASP